MGFHLSNVSSSPINNYDVHSLLRTLNDEISLSISRLHVQFVVRHGIRLCHHITCPLHQQNASYSPGIRKCSLH